MRISFAVESWSSGDILDRLGLGEVLDWTGEVVQWLIHLPVQIRRRQ